MSTEDWMKANGITADDIETVYTAPADPPPSSDNDDDALPCCGTTPGVMQQDHSVTSNKARAFTAHHKNALGAKQILSLIKRMADAYAAGGEKFPGSAGVEGTSFIYDLVANSKSKKDAVEKIAKFFIDKGINSATDDTWGVANVVYDYMMHSVGGRVVMYNTAKDDHDFSVEQMDDHDNYNNLPSYEYWKSRAKNDSKMMDEDKEEIDKIMNNEDGE
jgi:hypothetical protein